jgi:hypothetical protein
MERKRFSQKNNIAESRSLGINSQTSALFISREMQKMATETPIQKLLLPVHSLEAIRDRPKRKHMNLAHDAQLVERLCEFWYQRREVPFGGLLEMARAPFWAKRPAIPGLRAAKRPFTFAHCLALELPEETMQALLLKAHAAEQISERQLLFWLKTLPILQMQLEGLAELNRDQRRMVSGQGQINAALFFDKCLDLQPKLLQEFSFLELPSNYWNLVEDLCYRVQLHFAGLSENPSDISTNEIQQFTEKRSDEFLHAYQRLLRLPEYATLRKFLEKRFAGELLQQFAFIKVRADLLSLLSIQPIDLTERVTESHHETHPAH